MAPLPGPQRSENKRPTLRRAGEAIMGTLTRDRVIEIVGRIDDQRIAEIIATGATEAELIEAWTWLGAKEVTGRFDHRRPTGRSARLCDILAADEPPGPDEFS